VSGLSSEDRNLIGIYPLRGKLLNVRGESIKKITDTKEITDLKKILGLENGRSYETIEDVRQHLRSLLGDDDRSFHLADSGPTVILIAGVNGSGKTTSIAKLAHRFHKEGKKVLVAACDTFRAAAVEQLALWAQRTGVEIVKGQTGADPASVAHDACVKAQARGFDILIVDTAGRLHTQTHLMRELEKIQRILAKQIPGAPHEAIMILDATNGQNAIAQAQEFQKVINSTGLIVTKLDGTAKGGSVFAIKQKLQLPVKLIGVGEGMDDLEPFDPDAFVAALFE
jgi:fused signal recognition particle receptor